MTEQTERRVLLRSVFAGVSPSWRDWTDRGIDAAIEYATSKQTEGGAHPMEIVEVEIVRKVAIRTTVTVVEDTAAEMGGTP